MVYPRISIVTPSYNQGAFIESTILSVLDQGYPDLEYFVIDGGSTDQTPEILEKYSSRLTGWVSEKDNGQSHAINKGLKMATGEIVSWLCSDDLYTPDALNRVAGLFKKHPESMMIHGKTILFDEGGKETVKGAESKDLWLRYFSVIPYPQPSSFFRKRLADEQGLLREDLHFAMDYDLLMRAALNYTITPADEILSKYRLHEESKTVKQLSKFETEWMLVFSKFLRSVEGGETYFSLLSGCGLYAHHDDAYVHNRKFSPDDLRKIVLYYLDFMAHLSYQFLEKAKAKQRLSMIRDMDRDFYDSRGLNKISMRTVYLPSGLIKLMRKITR